MRKIELRNIKRLTANVGDHSSNEIDQILSLCIVKEADKRAKIFSMTKIGCFLCGFSRVDFSAVGVLGLLMTFKTQCQKVMFLYKSDFHWLSNAFLWFDFQTCGFT